MRLIFLVVAVNAVIFTITGIRIFQYLNLYKKLAKKLEEFDPQLFLQRYCDRVFKSPMNSLALFDDIRYPEDIPEKIKDQFGADFAIVRKVLFSALWWFGGGITIVIIEQWFLPGMT